MQLNGLCLFRRFGFRLCSGEGALPSGNIDRRRPPQVIARRCYTLQPDCGR
jgi:hypothetical protein